MTAEKFVTYIAIVSVIFYTGFFIGRTFEKPEYRIDLKQNYLLITNQENKTTKVEYSKDLSAPIEQYFINDNE